MAASPAARQLPSVTVSNAADHLDGPQFSLHR